MTHIALYNVIYNLMYVFIGSIFFGSFLTRRKLNHITSYICIVFWFIAINIVSFSLDANVFMKLIIAVICNAVYVFFCYERQKNMYIIAIALSAMYQGLAVVSDAFTIGVQKTIIPNLSYSEVTKNITLILLGVISQLIQLVIVLLLNKTFRKKDGNVIPWKEWAVYSVFPIYSIIVITLLLCAFDGVSGKNQINAFFYISISLLALNLVVYYIINTEINRQLKIQKNDMVVSHAKEVIELYETISRERKELGKREHEYNNTINALAKLYSSGQIEKVGNLLKEYSEQFTESDVFDTGNPIMSTLFNIKYAEAQKQGIRFQFVINDLSELKIKDQDAIILVSNILNNAIEAASKCDTNKRYIKMKAVIENNQFIFAVTNSYIHDLHSSNNKLISTKNDSVSHGFGIDRIIEIIDSYNGFYDIDYSSEEFTFSLIIQ